MSEMFASGHHHQSTNQAQHLPPACGARQLSKLKRFLTTIQHYAADISPEVLQNTRELMLALVNQQFSIEVFHSKMQQVINLPMRPFIIPFLKANLPLLQRELFYCSQMSRQSPNVFLPGGQADGRASLEPEGPTKTPMTADRGRPNIDETVSSVQPGKDQKGGNISSGENSSKRDAEYDNAKSVVDEAKDRKDVLSKASARDLTLCGDKFSESFKNFEDKIKTELDSNEGRNLEKVTKEFGAGQSNLPFIGGFVNNKLRVAVDAKEGQYVATVSKRKYVDEEMEIEEKKYKVDELEYFKSSKGNIALEANDSKRSDEALNRQEGPSEDYQHIQDLQKEIDLKKIELNRMREEYNSRMKTIEKNTLN